MLGLIFPDIFADIAMSVILWICHLQLHRQFGCGGPHLAMFMLAREFRLYMDFDILTGPLQPENSLCVEVVDNVCTRAYMQFY